MKCVTAHNISNEIDILMTCNNKGVAADSNNLNAWWRPQMEMVSVLQALCEGDPPVTGGYPLQGASNARFDVFYDVSWNKRLSKTVDSPAIWDARAYCGMSLDFRFFVVRQKKKTTVEPPPLLQLAVSDR